jgi:DNA-binding MarR family transcriptional regulator
MEREKKIMDITNALLIIPRVVGKNIGNILLNDVFSAVKDDIWPQHFSIMKILNDSGPTNISSMADWLRIERSQMTHMVNKLEKKGYISREGNGSDRRSVKISITEKGREAYAEWLLAIRKRMENIIGCLTDEEINEMADSLIKLHDITIKLMENSHRTRMSGF